ncbi:O-acetyl-ADP-ribose deacetylase [uncultured Draconibacterium sp.]|uniref:O-acetyl-ADP-ribose deacetylase n=1 Tax=uncultured Draconibacterium sp. TaxID=1573823 RepID=UPI0025F823D1|nr:O-acetyl-ADP-ribose deacetylase [uncultured Draconibacterium sp.]
MTEILLHRGDITKLKVDAIVNAANQTLLGGGGVDGAIHRAAGPELLNECKTLNGCKTGQAKITQGYKLPAKHVIHTVGPVYKGGRFQEAEKLTACYESCLQLAAQHKIKSIAFPNISTGIYGYPKNDAAKIATTVVKQFFAVPSSIEKLIFCVFDEENYTIYKELLK